MSDETLAPCPFCGDTATARPMPADALWKVCCDSCNARGPYGETAAEAVGEWNRRVNEAIEQAQKETA